MTGYLGGDGGLHMTGYLGRGGLHMTGYCVRGVGAYDRVLWGWGGHVDWVSGWRGAYDWYCVRGVGCI